MPSSFMNQDLFVLSDTCGYTMPPKRRKESSSDEGSNEFTGQDSKRVKCDKNSSEYKERRDRNNVAVKKSREKSREKARSTKDRVSNLRQENEELEKKVQILSKELSVLKDLFLAHASSVSPNGDCKVNDEPKVKDEPISQAMNTDHQYSITHKNK